ncbi:MAG TPA: type VI secretion system accessory protein TagJ [Polyangia bacterium]|nr:type VI secretion system accessory protein TagJ [Polyangia bacterium]
MQAAERLKSGNIEEALADLQAEVRKHPSNPQTRIFLFQLLCLMGRWDRARTQLEVLADMSKETTSMVQTYGAVLACEEVRAEVFAGKRPPLVFGKPGEWIALLLEALKLTAQGKHKEAGALRARAFEEAPTTAGKSEGNPFAWIADADPRLGPMLEAVVNGKYYWIPFQRLREIRVEKPTDLRDLVWTPAYLTLANGGETVALIPTRYPGSEASDDNAIRLARKTTWVEADPDTFLGLGQRLFTTDQGELALLDVRSIQLEGVAEAEPDASPPDAPTPS